MKHEDKLDFISKKLEEESEPIPVSLEKESVVEMLKSADAPKKKTARIIPFKRYASIAAALIVIVSAVFVGGKMKNKISPNSAVQGDHESGEAFPAISLENARENHDGYSEIESYFIERHKNAKEDQSTYSKSNDVAAGGLIINDSASASTAKFAPFALTNTQVSGVDEADVIKNDGRYLYVVTDNKIYITDAQSMKQVGVIDKFVNKGEKSKTDTVVRDIYVNGDVLTVIVSEITLNDDAAVYNGVCKVIADCAYPMWFGDEDTLICTYDISDRADPKPTATHRQSGGYQNSRAVDGKLYTVSFYGVDISHDRTEAEIKSDCVPLIDGEKIKPADIKIGSDGKNDKTYVVIASFDIGGSSDNNSSYAYLGYCDELYATKDNIYIVSVEYGTGTSDYARTTRIVSLSVSGGKIRFKSEGQVSGSVDDQYSMDEHNGYFRIVTTDMEENKDDISSVSSLYVLDESLKTVGKLVDIAKNEGVESVRFMGDTAYIITFENTDPLFTVDLTEPTDPKITGSVELPGFSSYLHPIDGGYILGVGYNGDGDGADYSSVKVTLFNVTDPSSPKVSDEYVISEAETDVNYEPKAFVFYPEKHLVGIPASVQDGNGTKCVYYMLEAENGKLAAKQKLLHSFDGRSEDCSGLFRGTYIGDTAYTVSDKGICSFDIDSGKRLGSLKFN